MTKKDETLVTSAEKEQDITQEEVPILIALLRYIDSFLTNIIWGIVIKCLFNKIPRLIFDICKSILTFIWDTLKNFLSWVFKNFGRILEFFGRSIKIGLLLTILIALVCWPVFLESTYPQGYGWIWVAWLFMIIVPGISYGFLRWRRRTKMKPMDVSPDQNGKNAQENDEKPMEQTVQRQPQKADSHNE